MMDTMPAARYSDEFKTQVVCEVIEKDRTIASVAASYDLVAQTVGMDCWVFFGQCLFVFQAAFFRPKNSLSASFGVRYPRAE